MRLICSSAFVLCLPAAALAEDILLRADITEALVFARGAEVTRNADLDLPAGRHSLFIPMRDLDDPALIAVIGPDGTRMGAPVALDTIPIAEGALDTPPEARARAALDAAEAAVQAAEDALARRDADIAGIETQLGYLAALARGGTDGAQMPADPADLSETLTVLGAETARLGRALQDARVARRGDEAALETRLREREAAKIALHDLGPFGPQSPGIRIDLEAERAVSGALAISYFAPDASWSQSYALRLDTTAERLTIARRITLRQGGAAPWRDVRLHFSTARPERRRWPAGVTPDPVRIAPAAPGLRSGQGAADLAPLADPAAMTAEMAAPRVDGLALVYDYATPVTVGPTGQVTLPLDRVAMNVTLENRAVPRRDATAYLVAMGTNETGTPLLPGPARFFRDGELVGRDALPPVPTGGEIEIGFGPLDHLPLFWRDLSLEEGQRGVFVGESEQRRRIAFGVENTSATPQEVRLLYAAPFAEQEDLDLELDFAPAPDSIGVDDLRGVAEWDLSVPAGSETRIEMTVELAWPEDMTLTWRP